LRSFRCDDIGKNNFYPVLKDEQGNLTYAGLNANGRFVPTTDLVGNSSPPATMLNRLLPEGQALSTLQADVA
jgi:hypothetical protein